MRRQWFRSPGATFVALAVFLAVAAPAGAQVNTTTAEIAGTVRDEGGGGLPGVTVEGTNTETGFRRFAITDTNGRYVLTLLPPGKYSVTALMQGLQSVRREGLTLALGSSSRVDFTLRVAAVSQSVTVTGEVPVIEETKTEVSSTVNENSIKNLPLQTRNFTDLVVLTPGATSDDSGRVHLSGQRGIGNSFNVDGADSNSSFFGEQRGGTRPPFTFSQGAIQEFQVITSSYNAQYGNATGGIINAITKSGTNQFHAEVFGFYRSKALSQPDANGFIGDGFEQKQFGGFVGGPIVKDRLFFFGGYDGQRLDDPFQAGYVGMGTSADPLLDPKNLAALTKWGINPATEWGTVNQTNNVDSPFFKLSWNASDSVTVSLRDNYNKQQGDNLTNGRTFPDDGLSNNGQESNFFNSLVGNLNWVVSPAVFNELIAQAATEHRPRNANSQTLPETVIANFGRFGQNNFLPNNLDETRLQFTDNVSFFSGNNTVKAGVDYAHVKYSDEFYRYRLGVYNFASITDFVNGSARSFRQDFSAYGGLVDYTSDFLSGYVQDDWRPTPRLTVNFGLRYDYQRQPDSVDKNPLYPAVETIPSDSNNWGPRLGFAWDPAGTGKSVVRGGIGVFYVYSPSLLTANALLNNGVRVLDYNITCSGTSPCPLYPNLWVGPPTSGATKPGLFVYDQGFQNTSTTRVSLGYEQEVVRDLSVEADLIYARTRNLERVRDANLTLVGLTPDGRPRYTTTPRPNASFGAIQTFMSDGDGEYKGVLVSIRKRLSNGLQFAASYAYGDSRDNQSNERSVSIGTNSPEDANNLNADYGPSDFDIRHTIVVSGVFDLPWGLTFAPLYRWRTGAPWTPGNSVDVNGDGVFNDRANDLVNCDANGACDLGPNHASRNSMRQPVSQQLDVTLSKDFSNVLASGVGATIYVQVFNLAHSSNRYVSNANWNEVISAGVVNGVQKYKANPTFNVPDRVGTARQFQLGVRISM